MANSIKDFFGDLIKKFFGTRQEREIKYYQPFIDEINKVYETLKDISEEELKGKTEKFRSLIRERITEIEDEYEELYLEIKEEEDQDKRDKLLNRLNELEDLIHDEEQDVLEDILPEAFAVVKEACRRNLNKKFTVTGQEYVWDMVPFDVQLIGSISIHEGKISEMATGEGKTLVAIMPVYLNALSGKGVHVVTVNDYLAKRDSQWMSMIYEYLGLTVGCIQNDIPNDKRRQQYEKDITYGTASEFGFDYLRDNMVIDLEQKVQKRHNFAIIDEVDSILIDEARTPLIISGPSGKSEMKYEEINPLIKQLMKKQVNLINGFMNQAEKLIAKEERTSDEDYELGELLLMTKKGMPKHKRLIKIKTPELLKLIEQQEFLHIQNKDMHEVTEELYFSVEEKQNTVDLTDKGREEISKSGFDFFVVEDLDFELHQIEKDNSLTVMEKKEKSDKLIKGYSATSTKLHNMQQILKAYTLFEKDVDYVVMDEKVIIVDQFTGRLMPSRRFSDGLHQALEAKESVQIGEETQTFATITLQNYFRKYSKLSGMTGTAITEEGEFVEIYELPVSVIPTNRPIARDDMDDRIYLSKREKFYAIIDDIAEKYQAGRPVLVGTISVETSELLSKMLKARRIPHSVLNAKYHQKEADIVRTAGHSGAVTIATNMAGRGTDIKLSDETRKAGGLHVIGTERHESRRIDRQLRGRSGRQGDPGSSQFYISLEDDLMRLFGSDRMTGILSRMQYQEGEALSHPWLSKSIERAQKRVELNNFGIRKQLLDFDDVMNKQREVIYANRNEVLNEMNIRPQIEIFIADIIEEHFEDYFPAGSYDSQYDFKGFYDFLIEKFLFVYDKGNLPDNYTLDFMKDDVIRKLIEVYHAKVENIGEERFRTIERFIMLQVIDHKWKDHLYSLDRLKEGINLRAYGQKDPLLEYKTEAFKLFKELNYDIALDAVRKLFRVEVVTKAPEQRESVFNLKAASARHREISSYTPQKDAAPAEPQNEMAKAAQASAPKEPVRVIKVGRNEPCPCGSGKKFKNCCGKAV